MPGFFESLSRMAKGEPVFQPGEDESAQTPPPPAPLPQEKSHRTDGKTAPLVTINRIECDIDELHMTVTAEVANHHNESVYVDKALLLGIHRDLDRDMRAGEEHEFLLYRGLRPTDTHQTRAELHYRNKSGDYFASIHFLEFKKLQDGLYIVDDVRFIPPVKDI